jgi:transposase
MENKPTRQPYPSDISDEEWAFVEPYFTLIRPDAGQRVYEMREILNAIRWITRTGAQWRYLPHDLPPWPLVYQQMRRWMAAGCFDDLLKALRYLDREAVGRDPEPTAAVVDSRTVRSTPESGARAGYDGHKRTNGSKIHLATDPRGNPLALTASPADEQDREHLGELLEKAQAATENHLEVAFADQGYTGEAAATAVQEAGVELQVIKLPGTKDGFVLLPRRWVVERTQAWAARFRRLARDYERLAKVLAGLHTAAFGFLLAQRLLSHLAGSS